MINFIDNHKIFFAAYNYLNKPNANIKKYSIIKEYY